MSEPQFTLEDMVTLETRISELEEERDNNFRIAKELEAANSMLVASAEAAEARVAELGRKLAEANATCVSISEYWRFQYAHRGTVIDQARELLQREGTVMRDDPDHIEARQAWLRAHPEPATPAATGAEPRYEYPAGRDDLRVEKEQGT